MMRVDHLAFVVTALLLVFLLRTTPRAVGRWIHALGSVGVLALALGDPASIAATAVFVALPFLAVRVKKELPTWGFAVVLGVQLSLLALLRRYFPALGLGALQLPVEVIGLSYVVLRQIEWVLWMGADDEAPVDLLAYINFTLGFFTLLAGPVARYEPFTAGFLTRDRVETLSDVVGALQRIAGGYVCVVLLAPLLGAFTATEVVTSPAARLRDWLLFVGLFPWQLYLNFAGYSGIVIGFAKLAHIDLPENFARPFAAPNVQEYWQRWHMSFSFWMRDLFFFPLMRALQRGPLRGRAHTATAVSLVACFLLIGVWHGPAFGFVLFGALHGLAILAVQLYRAWLSRRLGEDGVARYEASRGLRVVRVGLTYAFVALTSVCFERSAGDLAALASHFARVLGV